MILLKNILYSGLKQK